MSCAGGLGIRSERARQLLSVILVMVAQVLCFFNSIWSRDGAFASDAGGGWRVRKYGSMEGWNSEVTIHLEESIRGIRQLSE